MDNVLLENEKDPAILNDMARGARGTENVYVIDSSGPQTSTMSLGVRVQNGGLQQFGVGPVVRYPKIYVTKPKRSLQLYPWRTAKIVSIAQLICGVACIALGAVALNIHTELGHVGHGIWGGLSAVFAGAFGYASFRNKTKSWVRANFFASIVAASLMVASFGLSVASAANWRDYYSYSYFYSYSYYSSKSGRGGFAVDILLALFSAAEFVLAIGASGIGGQFVGCLDGFWRYCFFCYDSEGVAVCDTSMLPMLMQGQNQPVMIQYPDQPFVIQYPAQSGVSNSPCQNQGQPVMIQHPSQPQMMQVPVMIQHPSQPQMMQVSGPSGMTQYPVQYALIQIPYESAMVGSLSDQTTMHQTATGHTSDTTGLLPAEQLPSYSSVVGEQSPPVTVARESTA